MSERPPSAPEGFDWVVSLSGWRVEDNILFLHLRTAGRRDAVATFRALSPDIWRFTFLAPGASLPPPTPFIKNAPQCFLPLAAKEVPRGLKVEGPNLTLDIDRDPWSFRFLDEGGRIVCGENPADVDGLGRPLALPLGFVNSSGRRARVTESFLLRLDERLFGLGEKFTALDKKGQRVVSWTVDALGSTGERSHKNIPLLLSTTGYGLFLDTGARIDWDLGNLSCQSYTVTADCALLDAHIIRGPRLADIIDRYTELTGRPTVPPKWTFGLWLSSGGAHRDQKAVEALLEGADAHKVPADVLHIDPWWMKGRRYCDFRWNKEAFPDPAGLIRRIHERGMKVCLWEHPYISIESDLYEFGKRRGLFVKRLGGEVEVIDYGLSLAPRPEGVARLAGPEDSWNARVAIVDFTNDEAVAWYKDLHRPLLRQGVDVFKTDFGEDIPYDAVFANGETGATMHNAYPLLYNRAVFEVTEEEKGRGVVWSRSCAAGSQRYPVCWSGDPASDFVSLACTVRGGLSLGLSGIPFWSNDIGGYRGRPSDELYIRWAQFGLLCSHSRMHGNSSREPWAFSRQTLDIVRECVRLRYRLFPYFYSLAHEAHLTGMPLLRPLPLVFPEDPSACGRELEFLLGPWLLAAPVVESALSRQVYFPPGQWMDLWTGKSVRGPVFKSVPAPLERMPLFVREGAILPVMKPANRIPERRLDPLRVEIYPGGKSVFTFYEDEGATEFSAQRGDPKVMVSWNGPLPRRLHIVLPNWKGKGIKILGFELEGKSSPRSDIFALREDQAMTLQIPRSRRGLIRIGA